MLFLILILLMLSFAPLGNGNGWVASRGNAFLIGMGIYLLFLVAISLQNKILKKSIRRFRHLLLTGVNSAFLAFLAYFLFFLAGQRVFPHSNFIVSVFCLGLYFFSLFVFHLTAYPYLPAGGRGAVRSPSDYAMTQVRFIVPFVLPFLLFSAFFDLSLIIPEPLEPEGYLGGFIVTGAAILILLGTMLFFPPLIQKIWKCRDITDPALLSRLNGICRRGSFRHAGMKIWTVMNDSYTAGIIGILPRFRYVMFTRRLIDAISKESVEAILAHEIGHSRRKHLLIYPFIIFGMIVTAGLFSMIFGETIYEYFILQDMLHPSPLWKALYPLAVFIPYAVIALGYFRLVFGYFSRLFERQADLHVYELGVPPEYMIHALDELGHLTGKTHFHPSWHHHSINERMTFLERTIQDSRLIQAHHRRVKRNIILYSVILTTATTVLFSPLMPQVFPFDRLAEATSGLSRNIANFINAPLLRQLP